MNKKLFIVLFLISLMVFSGGCGGSSSSNHSLTETELGNESENETESENEVNSALRGVWTSVGNGTATITNTNVESDDLDVFLKAFGELPNEVLEQYKKEQEKKTVTSVNAPVTKTIVFFEDADVEESKDTAKLTAILIISDDSSYLPIFFNGVSLSTQSNNTNEWTAVTPDGNTLSINMTSDEQIIFSGKVYYLDNYYEFSTVINKNQPNIINPEEMLDGTWKLDGTQSGGYLVNNSEITTAVVPETVSILFKNTKGDADLKSNMSSFYSLRMKSSGTEKENNTSLLQNITSENEGSLKKISDNVYKLQGNIIFIENIDEIFMFMVNSENDTEQTCMFLPLKKVPFDLEAALNKNWTASENDGGGYVKFYIDSSDNDFDEFDIMLLNLIETVSLTLQNANLNFSNITVNDNGTITATLNFNALFFLTSKILEDWGFSGEFAPLSESVQVTVTKSGNFLQFEYDGSIFNISFISDKEVFLSVKSDEQGLDGSFVVRLKAN